MLLKIRFRQLLLFHFMPFHMPVFSRYAITLRADAAYAIFCQPCYTLLMPCLRYAIDIYTSYHAYATFRSASHYAPPCC